MNVIIITKHKGHVLNHHHATISRVRIPAFTCSGDLSRAELMMMTIADVIKQLVEAHEEGKDINLNKLVRY